MRIVLAQVNPKVGDIHYNKEMILRCVEQEYAAHQPDIIVFSELVICGYPPEDLLLRDDLHHQIQKALNEITEVCSQVALVIGHPEKTTEGIYNAASFIEGGKRQHVYFKQKLPNYSVFDEKRYFMAGSEPCVVDFKGRKIGLVICEDLWHEAPVKQTKMAGADIILSPNASPYHFGHRNDRVQIVQTRARENALGILYVNQVGGQDELVFDGRSLVVNEQGQLMHEMLAFEEDHYCIEWKENTINRLEATPTLSSMSLEQEIYQALVLGVKDYVKKNGFKGALLGLSGGIDSALTLSIAVDALGAEDVEAVMMPYQYTSDMSLEDAETEARVLGVHYRVMSIESIYHAFIKTLEPAFEDSEVDTTEQNLQSRCRGTLLMALSNKTGRLVLTTGNKSEVAVGYATLYGDMAGGFDVLKDVPKTWVYRLAHYRNQVAHHQNQQEVIPRRVIERAPSAELAPDQTDQDSLPDYATLDAILEAYVVDDKSISDIVALGFERETVVQVMCLVDSNEFKRRQAPPGVRISRRAFGRDRRYPITSGFTKALQ